MMARILKPKPEYPPQWDTFPWTRSVVLSFDASMKNTGWSMIVFTERSTPVVVEHGTIRTSPLTTRGFEDSLRRGSVIIEEVVGVCELAFGHRLAIDTVIHEMPKAMGRGQTKGSAEAPPISAMAVRAGVMWASEKFEMKRPEILMIQNQHMKKVLLGYNDPSITKQQVRDAVWASGIRVFRTNEHVADSIALALARQIDLRDERDISAWRRLTGKESRE